MAFNDYKLQHVLGSGGFGDVYKAQDVRHDRDVALKLYHWVLNESAEGDFLRECRASGRVSRHDSVVTILDSGITEDRRGFLVFEYIDGGNLSTKVAKDGPVDADTALLWSRQLAEALAYAHSLDVWHRDIKPDNVLLANDKALLADFGIAKIVDATDGSTRGGGFTAVYGAPERVIHGAQSDLGDLYSFGMTMWHMLTGEFPYGLTKTTPPVEAALKLREMPAPELKNLSIPEPLSALVTHLLQPDPTKRVQNAQKLLLRLQECSEWLLERQREAYWAERKRREDAAKQDPAKSEPTRPPSAPAKKGAGLPAPPNPRALLANADAAPLPKVKPPPGSERPPSNPETPPPPFVTPPPGGISSTPPIQHGGVGHVGPHSGSHPVQTGPVFGVSQPSWPAPHPQRRSSSRVLVISVIVALLIAIIVAAVLLLTLANQ